MGCFQTRPCEVREYNGQHKETGGGEWQSNPQLRQEMGMEP